ncbi:uncharacterized protein LOC127277613 [Leptopilina boulardi]|uniref:uncharacterized protein LOC127277613 n=1 Tax=Leptopilina boulardi TaxID=63433 RepID=UPI0021F64155|nr:uncharacterized protein LOC127277613 [Leptopilina boulardi]XP_051154852.1 uncharacterized protein LOC127277613 [Leptopilina boulardi]
MSNNFYPNSCYICKKTTSLKRCSRCNMISYCGEIHQKEHWDIHKDLCRIITNLTKQKKLTHLYENLRDSNSLTWLNSREEMWKKISSMLGRDLKSFEKHMFQFPRSCFVCYDTRQNNLINCPNCPLASFCKQHPRSIIHDELCGEMNFCHTIDNQLEYYQETLTNLIGILFSPPSLKKMPTSTSEYFDRILKPYPELNNEAKIYASTFIYLPLTIFGALEKLNKTSSTTLVIYVDVIDKINIFSLFCEILMHLMPNLENLMVITISGKVSCDEVTLCKKCISKKRKATLQQFTMQSMSKFNYNFVNLAIFNSLDPPDINDHRFKVFIQYRFVWNNFHCPLVLTSHTEIYAHRTKNHYELFCPNRGIIYNGINNFAGLCPFRIWQDWRIGRQSQFMLIANAIEDSSSTSNTMTENLPLMENIQPNAEQIFKKFNPGTCHVCKYHNTTISCTRCKMIFYCCKDHMKMNQLDHKTMCKVILGFLNEKETPHLFDKMKIDNDEKWLEAKVNFMKQAKLKLNRDLLNFEKQMFLFPKTCFVCHESDLSVLKTCLCSVSLCKLHRDDAEHKNLCKDFQLNIKLETSNEKPDEPFTTAASLKKKKKKILPSSMDKFIDLYFLLKSHHEEMQKFIVSDLLTRPLTFIYAVEKLKIHIPKTISIHIVGATGEEFDHVGYWQTLFYWFNSLHVLLIDFIGNELVEYDQLIFKSPFKLPDFYLDGRQLSLNSFKGRYDEFVKSEEFSEPDIIIGYNLNIHESNYGISENTWQETLSTISKMNVPFIMTAPSAKRGIKDHEMLCSLLNKTINYEFAIENPYASLVPDRDFETERLCYSNNYVIAYKDFSEANESLKNELVNLKIEN